MTSATLATRCRQRFAFTRKHGIAVLIGVGLTILGYVAVAAAVRHPSLALDDPTPVTFAGGAPAAAGVPADRDGALTIPALDQVTKVRNEVPQPRECNAGVTSACVFE